MEKKRTDIEELWCTLSDFFIDNEVPYHYIARRVVNHDLNIIEFHLFYNVAPACASNLFAVAPPVWNAFDEKEVIEDINKNGIMDNSQRTFWRDLWARYYKWTFKDDWEILQKHINDVKLERQR